MAINVVHIEDDTMLRDILRISFQAVEPDISLNQYISADAAIPYITKNKETIDLFILDIRLPGSMNGLQIAQTLRDMACPGFVVLTSAYGAPSHEWLDSLRAEYIPKPWHILDLTKKLLQYRLPLAAHV